MSERPCCSSPDPSPTVEARTDRRRLRNGVVLAGCAIALSWLGPYWHVSPGLVLMGTVLLFAMAAAALFATSLPGALPRRRSMLLFPLAALLLAGPWVPLGPRGRASALVEVFLPTMNRDPADIAPALPRLEDPFVADRIQSGDVLLVVWRLSEAPARTRLSVLAGLGTPLSGEDAARMDRAVSFVNGQPLGALETLEDAISRTLGAIPAEETPDGAVTLLLSTERLESASTGAPWRVGLSIGSAPDAPAGSADVAEAWRVVVSDGVVVSVQAGR